MLISKFTLWACALGLIGGLTLHAQDTPAQAAARAALQQKMSELDASPQVAAPASAAPASVPAVEVTPAGAAPVAETPTVAAPATAAAVAPPVPAVAEPAPAATVPETPAPAAATAPAPTTPEISPAGDTPAQAAARAAVLQKMQESVTPSAAAPVVWSKAEKLQRLLAQYKADQITPQQYHEQRAAIVAEP